MIERNLAPKARRLAEQFPAVTITGSRQSGKTTLARMAFPELPYASLEAPDVREFAIEDPRGFLAQFPDGAILDEVQRAPESSTSMLRLPRVDRLSMGDNRRRQGDMLT